MHINIDIQYHTYACVHIYTQLRGRYKYTAY